MKKPAKTKKKNNLLEKNEKCHLQIHRSLKTTAYQLQPLSIRINHPNPSDQDQGTKLKMKIVSSLHCCYDNRTTSMTSLLANRVAQPTKWRFLPKNLNQLVIFVIGLVFT